MNNKEKIKGQSCGVNTGFAIAFGIIILLVITLTIIYFYQFNGSLSINSGDWANLSTYLYGIPTMLLTALNVWLFYELTSAANSLSAEGQKTSDGIISVFADKEDKRSKTSIGLQIIDHYKDAQELLLQSIKIIKTNEAQDKIDFQKVHFAANNVLIMLNIIHTTKNLFPSVENYKNYDKYKEALEELANQSNEVLSSTSGSRALTSPRFYNSEGVVKMSADDLRIFYDEVIKKMSDDLGSILNFEKH